MEQPLRIFLIEDDMDDIELLQESLKDNNVQFTMNVVREGDKVSSYLKECTVLPHVIIMDFNLPKVHGKDILKTIKSFDGFKQIPLLVLTTSTAKDDIDYSYRMGANKYLTKPSSIKGFNETVAAILELAEG
jgi:DNA-binding response OmpR family regulator